MSILDLHADQFEANVLSSPQIAPPPKAPKFSAWSALPRGVAAAVAEGAAMVGGLEIQQDDKPLSELRRQEKESRQARYGDKTRSEIMRDAANSLRPEPETASVAEQLLFDASRVITKGVGYVGAGGPAAGFVAMAGDETLTQADQLQRKGVDRETALKAGAVQGGLTALGVVLPVAGGTLAKTAGLYALGGPGGFMAQQALTREILAADFPKVAEQFDPFDPVGLTVSALVPLPFAAWGMRSAKAAKAEAFRAGPIPSEQTPLASAVADAYRPTPEHADAARVVLLSEQRAGASLADPADIPAAGRHADALARAEDQIAAGERVSVADVAPVGRLADDFDPFKPREQITAAELPPAATVADDLRAMGQAAYWAQEGGTLMRTGIDTPGDGGMGGDVTGRTPWVPAAEWFGRMRSDLGRDGLTRQADIQAAIEKAINGEKLKAAERRTVDWMRVELDEIKNQLSAAQWLDVADAPALASDGFAAGLSRADAPDLAKTARAAELDPDAVERAAIQYENDDAGFMRAIQEIIDGSEQAAPQARQPSADPGADGAAARQAQGEPAAAAAGPAGDTPQGLTPGEQAAAAAADSRLAAITADHPDLLVQMDGMAQPMRMADFLASVKAEADEMAADAPLMQVAAECALLNGMG